MWLLGQIQSEWNPDINPNLVSLGSAIASSQYGKLDQERNGEILSNLEHGESFKLHDWAKDLERFVANEVWLEEELVKLLQKLYDFDELLKLANESDVFIDPCLMLTEMIQDHVWPQTPSGIARQMLN